ncbi:MAG: OmpA family protein [Bacteroidales bacterium]|nr:OmpA family protein [Bacteroidales bacterium]
MKKFILLSILFSGFFVLESQESADKEFQRAFRNADMFFYYDENYIHAASLYEPLLRTNPSHHNLAAKLGICYLNMEERKEEALNLLEKAAENVVASEKEYKQTGEKAPFDTPLYLALAYLKNDNLEKANEVFSDLKKKLTGDESIQSDYVDLQMRNIRYATEMKKRPLRIISDLFAPWLVNYPGACNPVLAKNDSVFIFTVKNQGKTQIYCSYKNGTWREPSNITPQLGGFDRLYSNSITGDGKHLVLFMDDGDDGNLYFSHRTDTSWSKIKSVGRFVNSVYWEGHGFITPDGNTMYFSSNRNGGEGGLDIWTSQRTGEYSWERPVNLGNEINTVYDENTPFYDEEDEALLFSSTGHISMGDYDVHRSTKRGDRWTQAVGMPFAFNDALENMSFILNNNAPGFVASRFDNSINNRNIFAIVAVDPADEITRASGTIKLDDGLNVDPSLANVSVNNLRTGETMKDIRINPDGTYNFDIKPGEYQVIISHDGYETDTMDLSLPLFFAGNYLPVNSTLIPDKVVSGDFLAIRNILFNFDKYNITDEAIPNLEILKKILTDYPALRIEVAGYTDAIGTTGYNRWLSDQRAQAVIDYFTSAGLDASRFVKKAFGESNFVAVNRNLDGTDNPEGRRYNRRVAFGIVDPKTGVTIRHEAYTPEHLRQPHALKYSIILTKTKQRFRPDHFSSLIDNDMLFVRAIPTDSLTIYALGTFFNRTDAQKYLGYAREKGLDDAYIVNQYDLDNETEALAAPMPEDVLMVARRIYTIQLKATRNPLDISRIFANYDGVKEIRSEDGFYKYVFGEYKTYAEAKEAIKPVLEEFEDAFVREINIFREK